MSIFNWADHLFKPVKCRFKPRMTHNGRSLREGMLEMTGTELELTALWEMGEADPYPGEWALSTKEGGRPVLCDVYWVASGDVEVIEGEENASG